MVKIIAATNQGVLKIGGNEILCAVLEDGRRVLTSKNFLEAIGRPYKGTYQHEKLPSFISAPNLAQIITQETIELAQPVKFRGTNNQLINGFRAELLPQVCWVYLDARKKGILSASQNHVAEKCEMLIKALATVGIVALVDEATGYQEDRNRKALQIILEKYLRKEFAAWARRFPDQFYQEMFRLRDWKWVGVSVKRPQVVGKFTNDIVYERLAPSILEELQRLNPKDEKGHRKTKHHQWLTEDIGHLALSQHLHAVIGLMRASQTWPGFYRLLNRAFPKKNQQLEFIFDEEE